jgi:hypothetical protein
VVGVLLITGHETSDSIRGQTYETIFVFTTFNNIIPKDHFENSCKTPCKTGLPFPSIFKLSTRGTSNLRCAWFYYDCSDIGRVKGNSIALYI